MRLALFADVLDNPIALDATPAALRRAGHPTADALASHFRGERSPSWLHA